MSPGGGVSVPAGAVPARDDEAVPGAAVAGAAAEDDVACGAGVLPGLLLQALAQNPAAARTTSRLVIVLALPMGRML
jgi:F0F1-type ATP synthase membrane subunit c/vacuolar-type H+-ATPase subunit K